MLKGTELSGVIKAFSDYRMLEGLRGVLVGYSGGADSASLLHILKRHCDSAGMYIAALHVHHGIRGEEADRDAEFCRASCERLGVPFIIEYADVPALAEKSGRGIEETARDVRYEAFRHAVENDSRLTAVATAHNADDNAETVILHLARGSGISGLCGIPPVRMMGNIPVIRPLIFTPKSEIIDYCEKNGIEYIFDSTNADTVYTRNYVRHEILPLFERLNPSFLRSVGRMTESVMQDAEYIDGEARKYFLEYCKDGGISAEVLVSLPYAVAYRVVCMLFREKSDRMLEKVHFDAVMNIAASKKEGACACIGDGVRVYIKNGCAVFKKGIPEANTEFSYELSEGINIFEGLPFAVCVRTGDSISADLQKDNETLENIYKLSIHTMVNSDKINRVLNIRSRRDGDSYVYGSMTRKLKKLYNDKGLPADARAILPVFCDGEGIVWVPGFGTADRVRSENCDTKIIFYHNGDIIP